MKAFMTGSSQRILWQHLPSFQIAQAIEGKPTAHLSENFVCQLTTPSPEALKNQLAHLVK
ncbi:MAG TPA: hypothetical protein DCS60_05690 [Opitutae bacterium]|nr:hypothetical protein [Opitutae bacterium]|tara:strand:- start:308 stop:487 length:180 start_codon:yes stop_codon:yes gene_type:complete